MNIRGETMQNTLSVLERRIQETKAAHAYLSRKTHDLKILLLNLQKERNALKNQLAPVLSLPNELLRAIFEILASDTSPLSIGILLSHVCQRFRSIAINTHMLWTRIEVSFRTPFDMVIAYLRRSKPLAFDLRFDIDTHQDYDSDSEFESESESEYSLYTNAEWKTIMSYMTHCRRLSARSDESTVMYELIDSLQEAKTPLLQSFRIEYHGHIDFYADSYCNIIDGGAPALISIRIAGWGLHQCLPPLTSVTSLTLLTTTQSMSWADFRVIVGGHPALTRLVIGDIFNHGDDFRSIITLPSLESLYIYVDDELKRYPDPRKILLAVSVPALEFLALEQVVEQHLEDITLYPELKHLNRFPCLRHLRVSLLCGQHVRPDIWLLFCIVFPYITHFTMRSDVHGMFTPGSFISALCRRYEASSISHAPLVLPKLHTLSFNQNTVDIGMLCNLVADRYAAGQPLRSLRLSAAILHHEALASTLNRLREHVEVGEYQAVALEGDDDS